MENHNLRDLAAGVVIGLLVLGTALGLVVGVLALIDVANVTHASCAGVEELRDTLVGLVQNSLHTLPHNSYYRAHPAELRQALQQTMHDIAVLQRVSCS